MTTIYKDTSTDHADWVLQFVWMGQDLDGDGKKEIVIANRNPRPDMDDERIIILEMQSGTEVERPEGALPASFILEQNYPNPFNPSTTIRYTLPEASYVTLSVFNALGQEVATLVQGEVDAGDHEVVFDAAGLASGAYVYRVTAGALSRARTLMVLR
jgi:hypothetical protein